MSEVRCKYPAKDYTVPSVVAERLFDLSWGNDACPSFCDPRQKDSDGSYLARLWVEHPEREFRESGSPTRFFVTINGADGNPTDRTFETDNVEVAMAKLAEFATKGLAQMVMGVAELFDAALQADKENPGSERAVALHNEAFVAAKREGWDWEADVQFRNWTLKATAPEILAEGKKRYQEFIDLPRHDETGADLRLERAVVAELNRIAPCCEASLEYPGFIDIKDCDYQWAIGTANEDWGMDLCTRDGNNICSFPIGFSSKSEDVAGIAAAIVARMKEGWARAPLAALQAYAVSPEYGHRTPLVVELLSLLADAVTIIENSEGADEHDEWLPRARAAVKGGAR